MNPDAMSPTVKKLNPHLVTAKKATAQKPRKPRDEREQRMQCSLVKWAKFMSIKHPELKLLYSNPAGGHRSKASAGKMKAEGQKPGVPDLTLPLARHGFHGLYIEMKAPGGKLSEYQQWWKDQLEAQGYRVVVPYSIEEAVIQISWYLKIECVLEGNEGNGRETDRT